MICLLVIFKKIDSWNVKLLPMCLLLRSYETCQYLYKCFFSELYKKYSIMADNDRHYWLHKEKYEGDVAMPLLEKGYLCYGWLFIAKEFDDFSQWDRIEAKIFDEFKCRPRNRFCLKRFLYEMKRGDWVVVPRPGGEFSMYEITDEKVYPFKNIPEEDVLSTNAKVVRLGDGFWKRKNGAQDLDLGIFRRVKKVLDWSSKKDYIGARLTSRLKYQMANIGLDDLREEVEKAYDSARAQRKINVRNEILHNAPDLLKSMKEALEPGKFEQLVGWYFKKMGATEVDIPSKNMSGKTDIEDVDVTAYFSQLRVCFHVQVKFHDDISNEHAIEQVSKAKETGHYEKDDSDVDIYWALTSADDFSVKAKQTATAENIRLVTGPEFMAMLLDVGIGDIDSAF